MIKFFEDEHQFVQQQFINRQFIKTIRTLKNEGFWLLIIFIEGDYPVNVKMPGYSLVDEYKKSHNAEVIGKMLLVKPNKEKLFWEEKILDGDTLLLIKEEEFDKFLKLNKEFRLEWLLENFGNDLKTQLKISEFFESNFNEIHLIIPPVYIYNSKSDETLG